MNWLPAPRCPLCGEYAQKLEIGEMRRFQCDRCGTYEAELPYLESLGQAPHPEPKLSGLARETSEVGGMLTITLENVESHRNRAPRSVPDQGNKLLLALGRRSKVGGAPVEVNLRTDAAWAYASSDSQELSYLLKYLHDTKLLSQFDWRSGRPLCVVSVDGWSAIETLRARNTLSDKAFVAMSFQSSFRYVFDEGIKPALETDTGWLAFRVDDKPHAGKIDDLIFAEINESRFVIADFTGHRNGVYFEAGYARGLGLPVIWACCEDQIKDLHFDTRQFNHVAWSKPEDLREKLVVMIRAIVGYGPHKKP